MPQENNASPLRLPPDFRRGSTSMGAGTQATKRCPDCGETLPLDSFGKNRSRQDGLNVYCRACTNEHSRRYVAANLEKVRESRRQYGRRRYASDPGRVLAANKLMRRKRPEIYRASQRRYYLTHKRERVASDTLNRAIRAGLLVRAPCEVCGAEPAQGHHSDYGRPLDVRWLCHKDHKRHHRDQRDKAREKEAT